MEVAILGCGYVGLELGRQLTENDHRVVGVRRSEKGLRAVESVGLEAVRADVTDPADLESVPDVDWVVYAASAGERSTEAARAVYVEGLATAVEAFADRASPPDRFVYTSSTGVYGDRDGAWVDEETPLAPETEREKVLVEAERIVRGESEAMAVESDETAELPGTVARFAGLYGPDRYRLERYLDGPVSEGFVNLLHRDDAAGAVRFLLENDLARDDVVLVVDDEPVRRSALAAWLADQCEVDGSPARTDADGGNQSQRTRASKRCSNAKLRGLGYEFAYPTYREGYQEAVTEHFGNV